MFWVYNVSVRHGAAKIAAAQSYYITEVSKWHIALMMIALTAEHVNLNVP